MSGISDLNQLLSSMRPQLRSGTFVFLTFDHAVADGLHPIMSFHEDEALTVIVAQDEADIASHPYDAVFSWISLGVHGDLRGVGLTAAFSRPLADAGISCNVVAAYYHDHIFVPANAAGKALEILNVLSAQYQ